MKECWFRIVNLKMRFLYSCGMLFQDYPNNLGQEMNTNDTLYNHVYDEHRQLQLYVNNPVFDSPFKTDIFNW